MSNHNEDFPLIEFGLSMPKPPASEKPKAVPPPVPTISELEQTLGILPMDPQLAKAVDQEINYAKYQSQIKEKAQEFINAFDIKKSAEQKVADDLRIKKSEEVKRTLLNEKQSALKAELDRFNLEFTSKVEVSRSEIKGLKEDVKEIKTQVESIINSTTGPRSYNEMSNFIGGLVNIGAIVANDFIGQVNKCEKWTDNDYATIRHRANSFLKGDMTTSLVEVKTLIGKANQDVQDRAELKNSPQEILVEVSSGITNLFVKNSEGTRIMFQFTKDLSRHEKAERLSHMLATGKGRITEQTILNITTPELTEADVTYWLDNYFTDHMHMDPHVSVSKKEARTSKEVAKINKLLSDNKLQIKDMDKYVALGILSSAGLKAWRIEDQASNNYFYNDFNGDEGTQEDHGGIFDVISDEEFSKLVDGLSFTPSKFESEVHRAAYRVAGKQVNNVTRSAIINALPEDKAELMKSFLASELGSSFVGMVGGLTLTHAMTNNNVAQNLAQELRVASLATLGNEAVGMVTNGMVGIIKRAVAELPELEKQSSISDEVTEEDFDLVVEEHREHLKMLN